MDERNIVHMLRYIGEKIGNHLTRLAVWLETPLGPNHPSLVFVSPATKGFDINGFTIQRIEFRLVVEGIHVARTTIHEQEDHVFGLGDLMGHPWLHGALPVGLSIGCQCLLLQETVFGKHARQGQ